MIALHNHKSEPRWNTLYRCSFIDTRKERNIGSVMKAPPLRLAQTEGTKEGKKEINWEGEEDEPKKMKEKRKNMIHIYNAEK